MRTQFERFFKQRKGLAYTVLFSCVFLLVFVMPKIFFSLDSSAKKMFWGCFLFSSGVFICLLYPKQKENASKEKKESPQTPKAYQQLIDEIARCHYELRKKQKWAYSCLIMGWIALLVGRWSAHPLYSHPIMAIPVFALAFLAATKSWEKVHELDVNIAECIIEGVKLEKKRGIKSAFFRDLANSYEGWNMWGFAFVRVSPFMMILFSLFNAGPLSLLTAYLSKFFVSDLTPSLIVYSGAGATLAMMGLFYARIACKPYSWLLWKLKAPIDGSL